MPPKAEASSHKSRATVLVCPHTDADTRFADATLVLRDEPWRWAVAAVACACSCGLILVLHQSIDSMQLLFFERFLCIAAEIVMVILSLVTTAWAVAPLCRSIIVVQRADPCVLMIKSVAGLPMLKRRIKLRADQPAQAKCRARICMVKWSVKHTWIPQGYLRPPIRFPQQEVVISEVREYLWRDRRALDQRPLSSRLSILYRRSSLWDEHFPGHPSWGPSSADWDAARTPPSMLACAPAWTVNQEKYWIELGTQEHGCIRVHCHSKCQAIEMLCAVSNRVRAGAKEEKDKPETCVAIEKALGCWERIDVPEQPCQSFIARIDKRGRGES